MCERNSNCSKTAAGKFHTAEQGFVAFLKSHVGGRLLRGKEDTRTGEGHKGGFSSICNVYVMGRKVSSKYGRYMERNWEFVISFSLLGFFRLSLVKDLSFFISNLSQTDTWSLCHDWPAALAPHAA